MWQLKLEKKAKSIKAGNLNSRHSYLITTVLSNLYTVAWCLDGLCVVQRWHFYPFLSWLTIGRNRFWKITCFDILMIFWHNITSIFLHVSIYHRNMDFFSICCETGKNISPHFSLQTIYCPHQKIQWECMSV